MQQKRFGESSVTVFAPVRPIFRAIVCTVVPEANKLDEQSWRELETLAEMSLRDRPPAMRRQLRLFLRMIQWLPIFRYGRSFTSLSAEQRIRVLRYLQDHRVELIRCGFWGIRTLAFLGYYGRRETLQAIGYAAVPRGWEARR
jgi:hypothetical protein